MSSGIKLHSAEYFNETRDLWWNRDFLNLMSQRWQLFKSKNILDVGCGVGYWGRTLSDFLPADAHIYGIDQEPSWIAAAKHNADGKGRAQQKFIYSVGDASKLPFPDNKFDFVTCQTLLIHVHDIKKVLLEMFRVVRHDGLVAVAEPNNLANSLILTNAHKDLSYDDLSNITRFQLICECGKANLKRGNNSSGEFIGSEFHNLGAKDIHIYISDKCLPLFFGHTSQNEKKVVNQLAESIKKDFWIWDKSQTYEYFEAGRMAEEKSFDFYWNLVVKTNAILKQKINDNSLTSNGGSLMYLISGRKP